MKAYEEEQYSDRRPKQMWHCWRCVSTGVIPVQVVCCRDSLMSAPARHASGTLEASCTLRQTQCSSQLHDSVSDSNGITVDFLVLQRRYL